MRLHKPRQPHQEPAKPKLTALSLLSKKLESIKSYIFNCDSSSNINDAETAYQEENISMRESLSVKEIDFLCEKEQQTVKDQYRLTFHTDNRSSIASIEQVELVEQNKPTRLNKEKNKTRPSVGPQYHIDLELEPDQISDFDTVKRQVHFLLNSFEIRIHPNHTPEQVKQKKKRISQILIAYFHISNQNFSVQYHPQQIQLVQSIFYGNLTKVKQLLGKNQQLINFKMKTTNYNLLYIASMTGHADIVEYFLQRKQCLNIKDAQNIPMNAASWYGHGQTIKLLIDNGISPIARSKKTNAIAAEECEHPQIITILTDVHDYRLQKILSGHQTSPERHIILTIIEGKTNIQTMTEMIQKNQNVLNFRSNYNNFSLLSIAIMSKNQSAVRMILKSGCYFDITTCVTTPMHLAIETESAQIVRLLIEYGLPHNVPDRYGYLPIQLVNYQEQQKVKPTKNDQQKTRKQIRTEALKQIYQQLTKANTYLSNTLCSDLVQKGELICVINIFDDKQNFIGRKLITKNYLRTFLKFKYRDAFHGTGFQKLTSIIEHGLKKPGTQVGHSLVETTAGKISTDQEFNGQKDWGKAIFTTPSIYYASYYVQGFERCESSLDICSQDENKKISFMPILQVKVQNNTFTEWQQTTGKAYELLPEEPLKIEYRTEVKDGQSDKVKDGQSDEVKDGQSDKVKDGQSDKVKDGQSDKVKDGQSDKVIVTAIILMDSKYYMNRLDKKSTHRKFGYQEITELFLNGKDEQIVGMYRQAQKLRLYQQETLNKK